MLELLLAKFLFVIVCFTYASYTDFKTREVPNTLWLFMLPFIALFTYLNFNLTSLCLSLFAGVLIGYIGFYRIAKFGGADAKAVMVLSVCFSSFFLNLPMFIYILLYSLVFAICYSVLKREFKKPLAFMPFLTLGVVAFMVTYLSTFILL